MGEGRCKRQGGALAIDGVVYCIPCCATQVLGIDPFKEFSMTLQNNFRQHPQELGRLFLKDEECNETFYDSAVRKFGIEKVFQLIEEYLPSDKEWAETHSGSYESYGFSFDGADYSTVANSTKLGTRLILYFDHRFRL